MSASVTQLEVLVEEPSSEAAVEILLKRFAGSLNASIHSFQGKSDLLKELPKRLRAYRRWLPETARILVLVDRDDEDCVDLKRRLDRMADDAGFPARRTAARNGRLHVINRIAVEELEAWYFGDWEAVRSAYPNALATIPKQAKYRQPDAIRGGTWECFERVMQKANYFRAGLGKISAARMIAPYLEPERSTSPSFLAFCKVLEELAEAEKSP